MDIRNKDKQIERMSSAFIPGSELPPVKMRKRRNPLPLILFILIILAVLGGGGYYWYKNSNISFTATSTTTPKSVKSEAEETRDLVAKVGKLLVLPAGEVPTVATVSDPEKLRAEPFFAKAKTGDKVLIYSQAKKAILYDPVANLILEVAPLNINENGN
jgi:hypothetical protein